MISTFEEMPRQLPSSAQLEVRHRISRYFYVAAAIAGFTVALVFLLWPPPVPRAHGQIIALMYAVIAGIGLIGLRLSAPQDKLMVTGLTLVSIVAIGSSSALLGWGLGAPGLGLFGLFAGLIYAVIGAREGRLVAVLGAVVVTALAYGHHQGLLPATGSVAALWFHWLMQLLIVAGGLGGGWIVSTVLWSFVLTARDRERRFEGLLHIAADAYWELAPDFRLTALTRERDGGRVLGPEYGVGQVPWDLPTFQCDPEVLDQMQADLEARQPFRDLAVAWVDASSSRHFLVSGEPRLDERGLFCGYWGVARDVTADMQARTALSATELRYQDLFERIPSALVMHRLGRVIDANPAALSLFGFRNLAAFRGTDLLSLYDSAEDRERARRRIEQAAELVPGEALPVTEYRLTAQTGRRLMVRATTIAVEWHDDLAVLSIFVDDTERRMAEDAVRRSEGMLSHLVASSPDVITLTDLATGRYSMVNQTFERVTGYTASDVIGKTSAELSIWADEDERGQFVAGLREHGSVRDVPARFQARDGRLLEMLVSGTRFVMDRRDFLVINARDVTDAERSRLEREAILDNASIGIALTRDRRFQMANPVFEQMFGWPAGTLVGQPGRAIWPDDETYAEIGRRMGPSLARGEAVEVESQAGRRDGSTFDCRILGRAIDRRNPAASATIWIVEDITERKRMDLALARARDDAEAASRAKSAFLANTSHELRTPLHGLLGLAQLARVSGLDESKRGRYLDQIVDSAQGLAVIVSDILDLSKIEAGKMVVESAPFDLPAMLGSMLRGHAAQAEARALALTLEVAPELAHVQGDALRLRQILNNFLGNALKFTLSGTVHLRALRIDGDTVRLEVHDTGPGIDAATQARLFQPFTQGDESTTRRFGGTGLGLSICRDLATLMQGQVGVTSEPGRGSCFWAEIPLPSVDAEAGQQAPDDAVGPSTEGVHVLVVDDNDINMMVAVAQLEQFGARVGQAQGGQAAINAVSAAEASGDPYDIVIMDLQMPDMSGHDVTRALRMHHSAERLPVIAYSAAALVTERDAALDAGMNDFLPKPTEPARMRAMVAHWAAVRQATSLPRH